MDLFSLTGQTALITGATRGIGSSVAVALARAGADIILIQRSTTTSATTYDTIRSHFPTRKVYIYTADLADPSQVSKLLPQILADGHEIRILVNCAGIQRRHPSEEFPDAEFNEVLQVNLQTPFTLSRDAGAHILTLPPLDSLGRRGTIINFASLLSFQGGITVPAYAASKGGIMQMSKTFANEWTSRGLNVNCIAPGYIDTEMNTALMADPVRSEQIGSRIPAGRWGKGEDFEGPVVFLASKAGAYVSGHTLVVDGGWMGR